MAQARVNDWRMQRDEWPPGTPAPHAGLFEEANVFGRPTGVLAAKDAGEPLPGAPRGFTWRPLSELSVAELRARAVQYRDMAATATTQEVMLALLKIAARLDAMADEKEHKQP